MATAEDPLDRIEVRSLYETDKAWTDAVTQAHYNLTHIPESINSEWETSQPGCAPSRIEFLQDTEYINNITDTDAVIITKLGIQLLLNNPITDPYFADEWELLADNFILIDKTNGRDVTEMVNVRDAYKSKAQWKKSTTTAKNILSKAPPPKFTDKWPILAQEEFRERMKQVNDNALITVSTAMKLSKGQKVSVLYQTDDWELLSELIRLVNNQ